MKPVFIVIGLIVLIVAGSLLLQHSNGIKNVLGIATQVSPTPSQSPAPGTMTHVGDIPSGSQPIYGTVTGIASNQLMIETKSRTGAVNRIKIILMSTTQYVGGGQKNIQIGETISGYGTADNKGSMVAQQIVVSSSK